MPNTERPRRHYPKTYFVRVVWGWDEGSVSEWDVGDMTLPAAYTVRGEVPYVEGMTADDVRAAVHADIEAHGWVIDGGIVDTPHNPKRSPLWDASCTVTSNEPTRTITGKSPVPPSWRGLEPPN